jgi:predicted transcriptional regulator YheO
MNTHDRFTDEALDQVLDLLGRVADAFCAILGPTAEIVVHDLRRPDNSVVALAGNLTGRRVGSPIPDPAFLPEQLTQITGDQVDYSTLTPRGEVLRSSTVFVRDLDGKIAAAICLNLDRNKLEEAHRLISHVLGPGEPPPAEDPPLRTFAADVQQLVQMVLDDVARDLQKDRHQFSREERARAVQECDRLGIFQFRHSATVVANELGVSRATVFNYLREGRDAAAAPELTWS